MKTSLTELPGKKSLALLGGLCFFLSTIEYMIPKPMPFMRLGIANLPIMLALDIFPFPVYLLLAAIKILGQALVTGTLFSYIFLFSLAGTALSALAMYTLRRIGRSSISFTGIGIAGAMVSNMAQLVMARVFLFGNAVRFIAPWFLAAGVITGASLGIFCELFTRRSQWYAKHRRSSE